MDFGLGLVLSFTDNATTGINNAVNSLNQLTATAESASASLNQMASLSSLSVVAGQMGNSFVNAGRGILGVFSNVLNQTKIIGSEFENFDVTLTSLFGGASEGAKKSQEALSKLFDFAKKSPLEVGDVKDMIVTLQSQGINAFDKATGAITGTRQEFLAFLTDLKSFKPEVSNERFKLAIQNYIGSGEKKMIRTVFDMGDIEDIIGHAVSDTAEGRMQDIIEMVEKRGLTGLSEEMSKTWSGVASNISDAFTQVYYSIANNGVFEKLKSSFVGMANSIITLNPERLQAMGKTIAEGLDIIVEPIVWVSDKVSKLINAIIDLCETNPSLVKLGMTLSALAGTFLVAIGVVLKATSALSGISLMWLAFGNSFNSIGYLFKTGALKMLSVLLPLTATIGLMYLAWKSDFAGIRTSLEYFVTNLSIGFNKARQSVNGNIVDLTNTLTKLRDEDDFFSNLTIGMMKVMMVGKALADAWSDYTLSEENFEKAKELGILPLIEAILDLKYRFGLFRDGFIEGWKEVGDTVKNFIFGIASGVDGTIFESLLDGATKFFQKLSDNDPKAWKEFGKIIGELTAKFLIAQLVVKSFVSVLNKILPIVAVVSKIGKVFKTLFVTILGFLSPIVKGFAEIKTLISGGMIAPVTKLGQAFVSLTTKISRLLGVMSTVKTAIVTAVTGIASSLSVPILAVVGVIMAVLSSIVIYVITRWEDFKGKMISIWNTLKEEASSIWESIKSGFIRVWDNLKGTISPLIGAFNNLKNKLTELFSRAKEVEVIQSLIEVLASVGETIFNILVPAIKFVVRIASTELQSILNVVVTVFNSIVSIIGSVLTNLINIISGILDVIIGIFTLDFERVLNGVVTVFGSILNVIGTTLTSAWNIVMSILSSISNLFTTVIAGIVNIVTGAFKGIVSVVGSLLDTLFSIVSTVWKGIELLIDGVMSKLSSSVQDKWNGIKTAISNAIEGARDKVKSAIDSIKGFFDFDWSLPKLKLPHFSIQGDFSLSPPSVPSIGVDWYAKGGVFNTPSIIGVGESGKEAVMPLENNTGWITQLAGMLVTRMVGSIVPTNTTQNSITNNQGNMQQDYLTNNNNTTHIQGDTDNSISFNSGAIQINVQNASESEAIKMAKKIMEYIKRQKELDEMFSYN